ncbi:MAG: FAD-dependent oxidoreductase [Nocardioidaceae bacterium]
MTRSFRVAVVGAGPAGIYAAQELLSHDEFDIEVDVIDRLPTPYGLVRYGVAPDHPKIKSIQRALQRTFEQPRIRFLGDVEIGSALTPGDLDEVYDAVVYSTGAALGRGLEIPGEDLPGVVSANDFVSWYSAHPDTAPGFLPETLRTATAVAVIGAGNVALDVARVLVKAVPLLAETDMPQHVLDRLAASRVKDVHLVIRRGPAQAKFTSKELREFADLDDVDVVLDAALLPTDGELEALDTHARNNIAAMRLLADHHVENPARRVHFHFWSRPTRVVGEASVEALEVASVRLDDDRLVDTGDLDLIAVQGVFPAVGYASTPVGDLPFDPAIARIPHADGRILDRGQVTPGRYVAGWVKRGPSGVVGSNRQDAIATVASVLADLADAPDSTATVAAADELLASRGVHPVSYDGWLGIDQAEIALGEASGRQRTKIHEWERLRHYGADTVPS